MILIAATITERLLQKSVSNSELTIAKYPPICLVADRNMERASRGFHRSHLNLPKEFGEGDAATVVSQDRSKEQEPVGADRAGEI